MGETDWRALEDLERAQLQAIHGRAGSALCAQLGASTANVADALVSVVAASRSILFNRVLGLGTAVPIERATLAAICDVYAQAGVDDYFVQIAPQVQSPKLQEMLKSCGLVKRRGWMKFLRDVAPPPSVVTSLEVRAADGERAAAFARIAAPAFDIAAAAAPMVAAAALADGMHACMSFDGEAPAGTGTLFARGELGLLDFGATDPGFRRRGGQGAVLAHRIAAASDLGCRTLVTTTGEAVAGQQQHSYRNIERMGFRPIYVRENWGPPKA